MAVLTALRTVTLPHGEIIPALGQGTWHMAEDPRRRSEEIAALRLGIDLGMSLIDTAEMYADGDAEVLVGEAIKRCRDQVFLVSKVLPHHASVRGTIEACDGSLLRLGVDVIDLYLLHWRGSVPLEETLEGFQRLRAAGKIGSWGVSNFDVADMQDLIDIPGGSELSTDQVLYNLEYRGIEYDLLPWCGRRRLPIMAYSPIEQGRVLDHSALRSVAARHHATPAQVALAWVLRSDNICAIPRASNPAHVRENRVALDMRLSASDFAELDYAFPVPTHKQPLTVH
jgi:diketogulonate reductase-like aldo/keto reductase